MRIKHVSWTNYRRLPDGRLTARNHIVLIGPNDTGKSSILRALHLCLGMAHGQVAAAITPRDFSDPSLPLLIKITLDGLDDEERAAFPDEITTGPPEVLEMHLEATFDSADLDQKTVRRFFPDSGHTRAPTKEQIRAIGFEFVPAARSLIRELGGVGGGTVRSLLSALDLTADAAALQAAADGYRAVLDRSKTLKGFRGNLADALTGALAAPVREEDVRIVTEAEVLQEPLSGVTVTVRDGHHDVPLAEQSDGIRALSLLTLLSMSHKSAKIVAIDEPETHLHPTAQRAVAASLQSSHSQRVVVTHSPSVVAKLNPLDIVTFGADRRARQLDANAPITDFETTVRHWSYRLIEPLTARHLLLVEGVADRILVEKVAALTGTELDRKGIALFELEGKNLFPLAYRLFGPAGFNLHLVGLLDEDARIACAAHIGVAPCDLEAAGFLVCDPDLEGMYIDGLGVEVVRNALCASSSIGERSLLTACAVPAITDIDRDALWKYCSHKRHKVAAALAVSKALDATRAGALTPMTALLQLVG
jgi:putative ATP-dependent endonuclease of OLD family